MIALHLLSLVDAILLEDAVIHGAVSKVKGEQLVIACTVIKHKSFLFCKLDRHLLKEPRVAIMHAQHYYMKNWKIKECDCWGQNLCSLTHRDGQYILQWTQTHKDMVRSTYRGEKLVFPSQKEAPSTQKKPRNWSKILNGLIQDTEQIICRLIQCDALFLRKNYDYPTE